MKRMVSLLLALIFAFSCAQAAFAENEQAVVDGIRLKMENGYVLVVTYDGRYSTPGETPEVVLTLSDGTEEAKTADELVRQVFEDDEEGAIYPQLFIRCGEESPDCSIHVGEGAFVDINGGPAPAVDLTRDDLDDESFNARWNCSAKRNIMTGEEFGPINAGEPIKMEWWPFSGEYCNVWRNASRLYLDGELTELDENRAFIPPTNGEQFTALYKLNDLVWDDYAFVWYDESNDDPNKLSLSERMALKRESFKADLEGAFAYSGVGLLIALCMPVAIVLLAMIAPPLGVVAPLVPLYAMIESFPYLFGAIFQSAPKDRWVPTTMWVD